MSDASPDTVTVSPTPIPSGQPQQPAFVASYLRMGVSGDGQGGKCLAFGFSDPAGNVLPPIILLNDRDAIGPNLLETFTRMVHEVSPPEDADQPTPSDTCGGCGQRIFGALIETGYCLTCQPASTDG
jgi:hypothetical protein